MAKQIAGKLSNVYIFGRFLKKIGGWRVGDGGVL